MKMFSMKDIKKMSKEVLAEQVQGKLIRGKKWNEEYTFKVVIIDWDDDTLKGTLFVDGKIRQIGQEFKFNEFLEYGYEIVGNDKDVPPPIPHNSKEHLCSCSNYDLFNFGCRCGGK